MKARGREISQESLVEKALLYNYKSNTSFHRGRSLLHTPWKCVGLLSKPWALFMVTFLEIEIKVFHVCPSMGNWMERYIDALLLSTLVEIILLVGEQVERAHNLSVFGNVHSPRAYGI